MPSALADSRGLILGLAIDHRDSLDVALRGRGPGDLGPDGIRLQKLAIVRSLAPFSSTVMIDHDYGALAIRDRACGGAALIMPLEAQGHAALGDEAEPVYRRRYPDLVAEAAAALAGAGADLLKLPVAVLDDGRSTSPADAYRRLADACLGRPWVLYGAGMELEALCRHLALAGQAGASGFLVGRTVWADLLAADPAVTAEAAHATGRPRFQRLVETAVEHCRPLARPAFTTPGPALAGPRPGGEG